MTIAVTPTRAFLRDLKGLKNNDSQQAVILALAKFGAEGKTKGLNFEAVRSRAGYFTIRASFQIRILLKEVSKDMDYQAVATGNHDYIYKSYFRK